MVKYIIVPNYCPLYAMTKCFGPTHGPLTKPCPTPVDIIHELLLQSGSEQVYIYEVGYDVEKKTTYGQPIKLNMSNYKTPYDTLVHQNDTNYHAGDVVTTEIKDSKPVTPTVIPSDSTEVEESKDQEMNVSEDPVTVESESTSVDTPKSNNVVIEVNEDVVVTEKAEVKEVKPEHESRELKRDSVKSVNNGKHMSKAERRALHRQSDHQSNRNESRESKDTDTSNNAE